MTQSTAPPARYRVTISQPMWRVFDVEIEVNSDDPRLTSLTGSMATDDVGAELTTGQRLLLDAASEHLQELAERGELPEEDHEEWGTPSIEGYDVLVTPSQAVATSLRALQESLQP